MKTIYNENGVSVLELLVSLVIVMIIGYSSISFFSDLGPSFDRWNSNIYALQDLRYAQTLAITEGCRVIVTIAEDQQGYSIGCDYLDYDYDAPHSVDATFLNRAMPNTVSISTDSTVIFNPKGQCIAANGDLTTRTVTLTSSASGTFLTASILPTGVVIDQ